MLDIQETLILIVGILITSALFYLILFFGFRRKLAFLFFSLFCIFQAGKALCRTDGAILQNLIGISDAQASLGTIISFYTAGICLVAFLVFQFQIIRPWLIIGLFSIIAFICYQYRTPYLPISLLAGLIISSYALWEKRPAAGLSIIGLLIFGAVAYLEQTKINVVGYYVGTIAFIGCITVFVGQQIRDQIRKQQEALLLSARLENQLLKKSIQPHYILNSLTSLQEWIEQSPKEAAQFVQELAEEFSLVSKISGQSLIPIEDELRICRAHLRIMGYRKQASFQLATEGIRGDEKVPPAIFHTLIENGLTHGYARKKNGCFKLSKQENGKKICYRLFNDGEPEHDDHKAGSGTGLKYVETRLEENYPGRWELQSAAVENGWEVLIKVR